MTRKLRGGGGIMDFFNGAATSVTTAVNNVASYLAPVQKSMNEELEKIEIQIIKLTDENKNIAPKAFETLETAKKTAHELLEQIQKNKETLKELRREKMKIKRLAALASEGEPTLSANSDLSSSDDMSMSELSPTDMTEMPSPIEHVVEPISEPVPSKYMTSTEHVEPSPSESRPEPLEHVESSPSESSLAPSEHMEPSPSESSLAPSEHMKPSPSESSMGLAEHMEPSPSESSLEQVEMPNSSSETIVGPPTETSDSSPSELHITVPESPSEEFHSAETESGKPKLSEKPKVGGTRRRRRYAYRRRSLRR
jgi:hypothetical protein